MKIYILNVPKKLQPVFQPIRYPRHNENYGVEQDFFTYINNNNSILTKNPDEANWHYLPVFWTKWHLNHNYGKQGVTELQEEVNKILVNTFKTFTICQYDDGPLIDLGKTTIFLASRKSEKGIDIPLLCSPHEIKFKTCKKKYTASFIGRIMTHPLRQVMATKLKQRRDIFIKDGDEGPKFFVQKILESYIALSPRGYGGSSFRFFEAMQLGVVPFLIGDLDTRPFKKYIPWDELSFYSNSGEDLLKKMDQCAKNRLLQMGQACKTWYDTELAYQKWCKYVLKELDDITKS